MRTRMICAGAALALVTALVPRMARGFEVRTSASGADVGWSSPSVTLNVDPSFVKGVYAAMDAAQDSARAWHTVNIAPQIQLTKGSGGDTIGALGKNVIFFEPDGYGPAGRALAITVLSYDDDSGTIMDADVVVNGAYRFAVLDPHALPEDGSMPFANDSESNGLSIDSAGVPGGSFDLTHVVAHEFGHVLGLRDEPNDDHALMYNFTSVNDASHRAPSVDDVEGIAAIYHNGRGRGCAAAPTRVPRLATIGGVLLLAVVLVARRRKGALALAAGACLLLLATPEVARGSAPAPAHARARVVSADTDARGSVWSTRVALAVEECRLAHCPGPTDVLVWGGKHEGIVQQVGEAPPLVVGDAVELSYVGTRGLRAIKVALDPGSSSAR